MRPTDRLRLELARRPWVHRALVGATALLVAWLVHGHALTVDRERARWGETIEVYVARTELAAGAAAADGVELVERPVAMIPARALGVHRPLGSTATVRRAIDAGEILTELDVAGDDRPGTLAPAGSLVVPVAEAVPSSPSLGTEVVVAVDGLALAEGVVVGAGDGIVLVAVPAGQAPAVAAASAGSVAVLLVVP